MKTTLKKMMAALAATVVLTMGSAGAAEEAKPATAPATAEASKAEEQKVTGSVSLGVYNKYIFRGYELSSGSVVFQPQLSASYYGFTATMWGNIDSRERATQSFLTSDYKLVNAGLVSAEDAGHKMSFNEVDLTLSYTYSIDKLSLTGGFIHYGTKYAKETQELFLSATYDILTKPTIAVYRDIKAYPGTYINLSFSHSEPLVKMAGGDLTVDLGASFGYMIGSSDYWKTYQYDWLAAGYSYSGSKYSGFHDGMLKAGLTIPVTKSFTIQPSVQYWYPLSSKARRVVDGTSYNPNGKLDNTFVYGIGLAFNF